MPLHEYIVSVIPGDGIGPEQVKIALTLMKRVKSIFGVPVSIITVEAGDHAYRKYGLAFPDDSIREVKKSHVCLKGPIGETAADVIVRLRQELNLYANVRPVRSYPNVSAVGDVDLVIVRENTECLYKGFEFKVTPEVALAIRVISYPCSRRIAKYAFELAKKRRGKVTVVHKANVLRLTCGVFVKACREVAKDYPEVSVEEQYVDACAANLIRRPKDFDVIVTTNMFGDILSDEAAQIVGGLGLAPAANIGENYAIFEPVHGAAFDIAEKGIANPTSIILATSMMFDWLGSKYRDETCIRVGKTIKRAVEDVLREGKTLTPDLGGNSSTEEMGGQIIRRIG